MKFLLTQEGKWARVAFFAVLFMLVPTLLQSSWDAYWKHYYRTAPIENFYESISLEASNICVGDTTQHLESTRFVKGTESGWAADIVRELYVIGKNRVRAKVFEESADVFIEVIPDGQNAREAAIPALSTGVYQWEITIIRLYLPYDVVRVATPSLTSNTFSVEDCNK